MLRSVEVRSLHVTFHTKANMMKMSSSPALLTIPMRVKRRVNTDKAAMIVPPIVAPITALPDACPDTDMSLASGGIVSRRLVQRCKVLQS